MWTTWCKRHYGLTSSTDKWNSYSISVFSKKNHSLLVRCQHQIFAFILAARNFRTDYHFFKTKYIYSKTSQGMFSDYSKATAAHRRCQESISFHIHRFSVSWIFSPNAPVKSIFECWIFREDDNNKNSLQKPYHPERRRLLLSRHDRFPVSVLRRGKIVWSFGGLNARESEKSASPCMRIKMRMWNWIVVTLRIRFHKDLSIGSCSRRISINEILSCTSWCDKSNCHEQNCHELKQNFHFSSFLYYFPLFSLLLYVSHFTVGNIIEIFSFIFSFDIQIQISFSTAGGRCIILDRVSSLLVSLNFTKASTFNGSILNAL